MSGGEVHTQKTKMTLGKGVGIYIAFLVGLVTLFALGMQVTVISFIPFIAYFLFGFLLNRMVLRGLIEWHPIYNTIQNVSKGKLSALVFWPITYPILFFKLGVIRFL